MPSSFSPSLSTAGCRESSFHFPDTPVTPVAVADTSNGNYHLNYKKDTNSHGEDTSKYENRYWPNTRNVSVGCDGHLNLNYIQNVISHGEDAFKSKYRFLPNTRKVPVDCGGPPAMVTPKKYSGNSDLAHIERTSKVPTLLDLVIGQEEFRGSYNLRPLNTAVRNLLSSRRSGERQDSREIHGSDPVDIISYVRKRGGRVMFCVRKTRRRGTELSHIDYEWYVVKRLRVKSPDDVICGTGDELTHHNGNRLFRNLVDARTTVYSQATRNSEKQDIIEEIVRLFKGNFVNSFMDSDITYVIPRERVLEKVKQCMRDRILKANKKQLRIKKKRKLEDEFSEKDFPTRSQTHNPVYRSLVDQHLYPSEAMKKNQEIRIQQKTAKIECEKLSHQSKIYFNEQISYYPYRKQLSTNSKRTSMKRVSWHHNVLVSKNSNQPRRENKISSSSASLKVLAALQNMGCDDEDARLLLSVGRTDVISCPVVEQPFFFSGKPTGILKVKDASKTRDLSKKPLKSEFCIRNRNTESGHSIADGYFRQNYFQTSKINNTDESNFRHGDVALALVELQCMK